jgi:AraC family transcriptional regulator
MYTCTIFRHSAWYIPRQALDVITDDQSVPRVRELRSPSDAKLDDAVIRSVGTTLLPAFERPEQANRLFVDCITTGLLAHLAHSYGDTIKRRLPRGGLAPWQERRANELLISHLNGDISLHELAREAGLSRSHFARAFVEVAELTGFANQSHFTRVFTSRVGLSPGEWRRQRRA